MSPRSGRNKDRIRGSGGNRAYPTLAKIMFPCQNMFLLLTKKPSKKLYKPGACNRDFTVILVTAKHSIIWHPNNYLERLNPKIPGFLRWYVVNVHQNSCAGKLWRLFSIVQFWVEVLFSVSPHYSATRATVSTKPRFLTLFWHFNKGAEHQSGCSSDTVIDM